MIEWSPPGEGDIIAWSHAGQCPDREWTSPAETVNDSGELTLPSDIFGELTDEGCTVTVDMARSRQGSVDPAQNRAGSIAASQTRSVSFLVKP